MASQIVKVCIFYFLVVQPDPSFAKNTTKSDLSSIKCFQCFQRVCSMTSENGQQTCRDDLNVTDYLQTHFQFPKHLCPSDPALWLNPDLDSQAVKVCPQFGSKCGKKSVKVVALKHYQTTLLSNTSNDGAHPPQYPILPPPQIPSEHSFLYNLHTCIPPKTLNLFCSPKEHSVKEHSGKSDNKTEEVENVVLEYHVQFGKKDCSVCRSNLCNRRSEGTDGDHGQINDSPICSGSIAFAILSVIISHPKLF